MARPLRKELFIAASLIKLEKLQQISKISNTRFFSYRERQLDPTTAFVRVSMDGGQNFLKVRIKIDSFVIQNSFVS